LLTSAKSVSRLVRPTGLGVTSGSGDVGHSDKTEFCNSLKWVKAPVPLPAWVKLFGPFCSRREVSAYRAIKLIDVLDDHLVGWCMGSVESVRVLDRVSHFRRQGKAFGTTSDGFERPRRLELTAAR
jgi:hypothetical protein